MKLIIVILLSITTVHAQFCDDPSLCRNSIFLPDYVKAQYAGSIGMLSVGPGYYLFNKKIEAELMAGYTPHQYYDDLINLTIKLNYKPFNKNLSKNINTTIVYFGFYSSNTFGENFWITQPDKYPDNYYFVSSGLRHGIYLGTSLFYIQDACKRQAEVYIECSTYDVLLYSYWPNRKTIPITDVLKLGIGMKVDF